LQGGGLKGGQTSSFEDQGGGEHIRGRETFKKPGSKSTLQPSEKKWGWLGEKRGDNCAHPLNEAIKGEKKKALDRPLEKKGLKESKRKRKPPRSHSKGKDRITNKKKYRKKGESLRGRFFASTDAILLEVHQPKEWGRQSRCPVQKRREEGGRQNMRSHKGEGNY